MDPISEAIKAIDLGNIMMAGAAIVTLVIFFVGIEKVKELLGFEKDNDDRYGYYKQVMATKDDSWYDENKYNELREKYGSESSGLDNFSDEEETAFKARMREEYPEETSHWDETWDSHYSVDDDDDF